MLSINALAMLAYNWLRDEGDAATLAAIDMAESGGNPEAHGDPVSSFNGRWDEYACNGYLSWGLGQIFLGVHHDLIASMSKETQPCMQAAWLTDPDNNMRAQAAVLANQGFAAWSTFKNGAYTKFLPDAQRAIADLIAKSQLSQLTPAPALGARVATHLTFEATDDDGRIRLVTLTITDPD